MERLRAAGVVREAPTVSVGVAVSRSVGSPIYKVGTKIVGVIVNETEA
jgi:hypothetical protein